MNYQELDEKDPSLGDTLRTTAKAFANRVGNAAVSTAGSYVGAGHEARGRLTARIMTDRLMKAWLTYKGGSGQRASRANVYRWLSRYTSTILGDERVRSITGMPAAPMAQPASPTPQAYDEQIAAHLKSLFDGIVAELTKP